MGGGRRPSSCRGMARFATLCTRYSAAKEELLSTFLMDGRSKPQAKELAKKILARGALVTEADVLAVLSLWRFKNNTDRLNVIPLGDESVFSDTLGLVQSRDGRVVSTASTRKYNHFFALLCRWQQDHKAQEQVRLSFQAYQ